MSIDYLDVRPTKARYEREGGGIGFDRVAFFTDAVYAIALTLIVVGIGVPTLTDAASTVELRDALWEQLPEFVSFAVGVFVIGNYWTAHHRFFSALRAVDGALVAITVAYVGFVAFLPFPISLVGAYDQNPMSVVLFAANLAAVSCAETLLLWRAWHGDLLTVRLTQPFYRWLLAMSFQAVPVFLLSIPIAFVDPWLAIGFWAVSRPVQVVLTRFRPDDAVAEAAVRP
jgi:uncharacterized membrane protein